MKRFLLLSATFCFIMNASAQINLDSALLAYYPLNGNGTDQSGNANNATVSSIGVYPEQDRSGFRNAALLFNGNLEQCSLTTASSLLNNLSSGSISFWYRH